MLSGCYATLESRLVAEEHPLSGWRGPPPYGFDSGQVIITPSAEKLMQRHGLDPQHLLGRHCSGDWGDQSDEDKKAWDRALENGLSVMSVYRVGGEEVWLMTDAERRVTTFLAPEEEE